VGKYRKVHLPGHAEHEPSRPFQHLEKRYFDVGDLGFPVWRALDGVLGMCICNDRRWPETYRVMGLQGVEMILLGYNTPAHNPPAPEQDALGPFHNHLVMQAGAYQNATWVVGVAKCGREEGCDLIGQSAIIAPSGEIVAQAATLGDELISARCDLDLTRSYKDTIFNFARHRRPEHYRLIVDRVGAEPPEERR
jgi:predicted amidohydrolase